MFLLRLDSKKHTPGGLGIGGEKKAHKEFLESDPNWGIGGYFFMFMCFFVLDGRPLKST